MNPSITFTEKYFYQEVCRFREFMGKKSWWVLPEEKREACIKALAYIYLQIQNDDGSNPDREQINKWAVVYGSVAAEYEQRNVYMILYPQ